MTAWRASSFAALLGLGVLCAPGCGSDEGDVRETADDSGVDHASGGGGGFDAGDAGVEQAPDGESEGEAGSAGTAGAAGGVGPDAADADAGDADAAQVEAGEDAAVADAAIDVPVSQYCGDGIRDPVTEECDDGNGSVPPDSCSSDCRVQDVLVLPGPGSDGGTPPAQARTLGRCRHPIAAGPSGFAVPLLDTSVSPYTLRLRAFSDSGTPGATVAVASGSTVLSESDPCVAALPSGKYAVAYADLNADGDGRGVALRVVDPGSAGSGSLVRVNTTTLDNQDQPDAIWTGGELVVAFTDQSVSGNLRDVKLRRFDANGAAKGGEEVVSATTANESGIALAPFAGGLAIAFRSSSGAVSEKVIVRAGGKEWTTETYAFGPTNDRPALAELDATRLLLVYTVGGASGVTARLRAMLIDTALSIAPVSFELTPQVAPYSTTPTLGQTQGNVVRAGNRVFVSWRSQAILGTVEDEELWLKPISWSAPNLDLSAVELRLPRSASHRVGDQQRPALAAGALTPGGSLVAAWDDRAKVFGSVQGLPDVVAELIPLPLVRLPAEGGLE